MWGFRFWGDIQVGLVGVQLMGFIGKVLRPGEFLLELCCILWLGLETFETLVVLLERGSSTERWR